ncbi:MAG: P-loop NTPase fold protein, partial [Pyrinomonadaceae bacterium]
MKESMAPEDLMPSTLDREIFKNDQDAFGHRHYAKALKSLIESRAHETPFSIGLLGGWDTGKSSIKQLYTTELADDQSKEGRLARHQRFHCITFNAWRFGGKDQDIKRALLRHVCLELGGEEESLHDKLFRQISESRSAPKTWREVWRELLVAWALPLPALLFAIGLLVALAFLTFKLLDVRDSLLGSAIFGSLTFVFTYLLKSLKPFPVSHTRPVTKVSLPSTSSEQFEDMLLEQLKLYKSGSA